MVKISSHINSIGTAVPDHEGHGAFVGWARNRIVDPRRAKLFARMTERAGIDRRWTVLPPAADGTQIDPGAFYHGPMPSTAARMRVYAAEAPGLALKAIAQLGPLGQISHIVVASCTGFIAPGIDQLLARALDLPPTVERTLVGFMGCYAAVAALRVADHIVRATPDARVLVVMVELCSLHLQATDEIEALLAMLQFGDGAGAAIVSAEPRGLAVDRFFAHTIPDSADLITWTIGDEGFVMNLAGAVPNRIGDALREPGMAEALTGDDAVDRWAVHGGGRSVLDAVARGLDLPDDALDWSRGVLADFGNMSSATIMFVLERIMADPVATQDGIAIAFGPGLAAEGFHFRSAA